MKRLLVGLIAAQAAPLNLEDAPAHPAFAYRPETGEDPFRAFLGVPVLRAGQTLGVLVVQNRDHRVYGEDGDDELTHAAHPTSRSGCSSSARPVRAYASRTVCRTAEESFASGWWKTAVNAVPVYST